MKALFVSCANIFESKGNGGCMDARAKFEYVKEYSNGDVDTFIFLDSNEKTLPPDENAYVIQLKNNLGILFASLLGYKRHYPWQLKKLKRMIDENDYDFIFVAQSILSTVTKLTKNKRAKTIVYFANVESDYSMNKVRNEGVIYYPSYWSSLYNEKLAMKADLICALNTRDGRRMKELYKREPDFYLPITFEDSCDLSLINKDVKTLGNTIVFLGSNFPPNRQSLEWFMENVMTKLKEFKLLVVGLGFEKEKSNYESKYSNVEVIGSVDNLKEIYYKYPLFVMPILYGSGMKVKTAEAMMYGRTILASDEALVGYDVEGINGIYRLNSANEYIEKIRELFNDGVPYYNEEVRELFLKNYEHHALKTIMFEELDKVTGGNK